MRGYGAPQVVFAVESMLDDAATALGIDPVEIRLRNAAREGEANPLGTVKRIYSAGLPECLEKGRKIFEWGKTPCRVPEPERQFTPRRWRRLF